MLIKTSKNDILITIFKLKKNKTYYLTHNSFNNKKRYNDVQLPNNYTKTFFKEKYKQLINLK